MDDNCLHVIPVTSSAKQTDLENSGQQQLLPGMQLGLDSCNDSIRNCGPIGGHYSSDVSRTSPYFHLLLFGPDVEDRRMCNGTKRHTRTLGSTLLADGGSLETSPRKKTNTLFLLRLAPRW